MEHSPEIIPIIDAYEAERSQAEGMLVVRGLNRALREQLVLKSTEPEIIRWTPRDASERFTSTESVELREADTEYYALIDNEDLAGIVWFSPRAREDSNYTFAIRLYRGYAGRGLATGLLHSAVEDFARIHPQERSIWLSVDKDNAAARHLYEKSGFVSIIDEDTREIMSKTLEAKHPKIVVIGGGTGSFTVLSGLKRYTDNITAVVNMSDDGGSSGQLRDEYGVLPPGDVRQCLVALSDNEFVRRAFQYRFKGGKFDKHSLGNILLSGVEQMTGDFEEAVRGLSQLLNIHGQVVPVTTQRSTLHARREDGSELSGEETIGHMNFGAERPEIWLEPSGGITDSAREAIAAADIVVIAPGNLYGSLAPALVVGGVKQALQATRAKKVYVSNLVTKPDQTEGFKVHDFADEIERFIGAPVLDFVLFNTDEPPKTLLSKYTHDGEYVLEFDLDTMDRAHYHAIGLPLVAKDPVVHTENDGLKNRRTLIRHDEDLLAKEIIKLLSR